MRRLLFALCLYGLIHSSPLQATPIVMQGSDYLMTLPPTFMNLGLIGTVDLTGNPAGLPGFVDPLPDSVALILERQADADLSGGSDTIPIELVAFSLKSVNPVFVPGPNAFFDIYIRVDPLTPAQGNMLISGDATGGTFAITNLSATMGLRYVKVGDPGVFFDQLVPGVGFSGNNPWSPNPRGLLVPGLVGDQQANWHLGAPPDHVDLFLTGPITLSDPDDSLTVDHPPAIPEPATCLLFGLGALGMVAWRRVKASRA